MTQGREAASVRVEQLSHRYPGAVAQALADVSFTVEPGLRVGLLGPNGAGKSTMMRLLCGFLPVQPGEGVRVEVDGRDVRRDPMGVRARVGYMPEHVPLYPELRAGEHLSFRAAIKGVRRRTRRHEVERVAELTGISDMLRSPIAELSRGYRQRVGIADALLGAPPLVVLDEPTVGLDPNQVVQIRAMLRDLGGAHTLVFSSHILAEVEALCDRVIILSQGKLVADESLQDALASGHVLGTWGAGLPEVTALITAAWSTAGLEGEPDMVAGEADADAAQGVTQARVQLGVGDQDKAQALLHALGRESLRREIPVFTLQPGQTRLEARFSEVTGGRRNERASKLA